MKNLKHRYKTKIHRDRSVSEKPSPVKVNNELSSMKIATGSISAEKKNLPEKQQEKAEVPEAKDSKFFMVASFAVLGFIFSFLTGYGHFEINLGLQYGAFGALGGFAVGMIPYLVVK